MSSRPIASILSDLAGTDPCADAIVAPDLTLSRANLVKIVDCYAHQMTANGVRPGDLVSINTSDAIISIASIFALSLVGARYIPFGTELLADNAPKVDHFLRSVERPITEGCGETVIDLSWSPLSPGAETSRFKPLGFKSEDDICWISPSSGTTGRAKYIAISCALLDKRLAAVATDYSQGQTRLLMLFHCASRPFVVRAIAALTSGNVIVDTSDVAFAEQAGANFICASPQQIRLWLGVHKFKRKVPTLQLSGAKIPDLLIAHLLDSFDRIEDVYGANETIKSHVNVYMHENGKVRIQGKQAQSDLQILDDQGVVCSIGAVGRVRVKTPEMVDEYLNDSSATTKHFKAGWFYPGDFAIRQADDVLDIIGRYEEIVNLEGQKIALSDIEQQLMAAPGIAMASCFSNPVVDREGQIAACIQLERNGPNFNTIEGAWLACVRCMGSLAAPGTVLIVNDLQLTPDGIAMRSLARKQFVTALKQATPHELKNMLFEFRGTHDV